MNHSKFEPISSGDLSVRLAEAPEEIIESQKLRFRIFCGEMGGTASPEAQAQQRDFDEFDEVCDHLLVVDNSLAKGSQVVGSYRLLRSSQMPKVGRYYSEAEYDVSKLKQVEGEILELGRSCVDMEYRSRTVMDLLWRGIGAYVAIHQIKIMFGCASFTGDDPEQHKLALSYLHYNHLAPKHLCPRTLEHLYSPMNLVPEDEVEMRAALKQMPPLIKGYLRVGGYIGDGAFLDHDFNTTDVSIVVETAQVSEKYASRYKPFGDEE